MDQISTNLSCLSGYSVVARSEIGSRSSQQDCAYIHGEDTRLFAGLCDGMGGTDQGGLSSRRTISVLEEMFSNQNTHDLAIESPIRFLQLMLSRSNKAVSCDADLQGGGTTLTALYLDNCFAYWASVGDSRLYILRNGEMIQATRDHNYRLFLDELLAQGRIGKKRYEDELVKGRALVSYIGIDKLRLFDLVQKPFSVCSGDIFLLTSDGLTGLLTETEIKDIIMSDKPLEQRADNLMKLALIRGEGLPMDNTTFVLIQAA